jgi:hypothetical protein
VTTAAPATATATAPPEISRASSVSTPPVTRMGWVTPLVVTLVAVVVVSSSASPSTPPLSVTSVNVA